MAEPMARVAHMTSIKALQPTRSHREAATYLNGRHLCELKIAPHTGDTRTLADTVFVNFGAVVNPSRLVIPG